jgi:hypothetical protein
MGSTRQRLRGESESRSAGEASPRVLGVTTSVLLSHAHGVKRHDRNRRAARVKGGSVGGDRSGNSPPWRDTAPRRIPMTTERGGENGRGREKREHGLAVLTLGGARPSSSTEGRWCSECGKCIGDGGGAPEARQLHGWRRSSANFGKPLRAKGRGIGWGMWRNEVSRRRR